MSTWSTVSHRAPQNDHSQRHGCPDICIQIKTGNEQVDIVDDVGGKQEGPQQRVDRLPHRARPDSRHRHIQLSDVAGCECPKCELHQVKPSSRGRSSCAVQQAIHHIKDAQPRTTSEKVHLKKTWMRPQITMPQSAENSIGPMNLQAETAFRNA